LLLVFALLLAAVSPLQWATMWILVLGTFAALFIMATKDRRGVSSFGLAVASTLTVMLLARSASIAAITAAQGPAVLHWYVFQSPASFLAFGAYLYSLGTLCVRSRLSASLYGAAASVLGAVLFLGGVPLDGAAQGIAIVFVKAAALLLAAQAFEARFKAACSMSALGVILASLTFVIDLGALFPRWSALAVGCACALAARAIVPPLRRASAPVVA
jgi:hypothetical protein